MKTATPDLPFTYDYCQHGSGQTIKTFATADEAIDYAKSEWEAYRSHPEHTRGGEYRGEWSASATVFDGGEAVDSVQLWSARADEI